MHRSPPSHAPPPSHVPPTAVLPPHSNRPQVFEKFLAGGTLQECYGAVAAVANRWLDMLDTQGVDLTDDELVEHISESSVMSKSLEEYEGVGEMGKGAGGVRRPEREVHHITPRLTLSDTAHTSPSEGRKSCAITCAKRLGQLLGR